VSERLTVLLHDEADRLHVPAPPAVETLAAAHRARRRRTTTRLAAAGCAVAVITAVAVCAAVLRNDGSGVPPGDGVVSDPAPMGAAADVGAVFAVGDTVYLRGGAVSATMDETVQAMYLTSAGVLVRTNKDGASDGGAPFHFSLIAPDGTTSDLGLTLGEVVPATDPSEPYLAYASMTDNAIQAVVVDVTSGAEVARVDVPGSFSWGGWEGPPVALAGSTVYVGNDDATEMVDWRTGKASRSEVIPGSTVPDVSGGHVVVDGGRAVSVLDAATGEDLLELHAGKLPYVTLSPDGRYAKVVDQAKRSGFEVYSIADGSHVGFHGAAWTYGWTSDGDLFGVSADGVEVCAAETGDCTTNPLPDGVHVAENTFVRVLGMTYES
jgi:rhodanese-related sulfurtransferase